MRRRSRPSTITYLWSVFLAACGTMGGGSGGDITVLNAQQLAELGPGVSAYEAIERLRPTWLRDRGITSPTPQFADDTLPRLHVDSTPFPLETLRSMRAVDVESIRFMDSRDATTRFGTGYVNGLIDVRTRGTRPPLGG